MSIKRNVFKLSGNLALGSEICDSINNYNNPKNDNKIYQQTKERINSFKNYQNQCLLGLQQQQNQQHKQQQHSTKQTNNHHNHNESSTNKMMKYSNKNDVDQYINSLSNKNIQRRINRKNVNNGDDERWQKQQPQPQHKQQKQYNQQRKKYVYQQQQFLQKQLIKQPSHQPIRRQQTYQQRKRQQQNPATNNNEYEYQQQQRSNTTTTTRRSEKMRQPLTKQKQKTPTITTITNQYNNPISNQNKYSVAVVDNDNDIPINSINSINSNITPSIKQYDPSTFQLCREGCGRKFNPDSIAKHQKVCKKVFQNKRKEFNAQQHRLVQQQQKKFIKKGVLLQKKIKQKQQKNKGTQPNNKIIPKWKAQSLGFRAILKANQKGGKEMSQEDKQLISQAEEASKMKCKFCGRSFNHQAGSRHIVFCESQYKKNAMKKKPVKK